MRLKSDPKFALPSLLPLSSPLPSSSSSSSSPPPPSLWKPARKADSLSSVSSSVISQLRVILLESFEKKATIYKEKRLLFRWKRRESWATLSFLENRRRLECNCFVEFEFAKVISRVSNVVATRFLWHISMQLSRDSFRIDSFYVQIEILFVRRWECEFSTFYRNFALKHALFIH